MISGCLYSLLGHVTLEYWLLYKVFRLSGSKQTEILSMSPRYFQILCANCHIDKYSWINIGLCWNTNISPWVGRSRGLYSKLAHKTIFSEFQAVTLPKYYSLISFGAQWIDWASLLFWVCLWTLRINHCPEALYREDTRPSQLYCYSLI